MTVLERFLIGFSGADIDVLNSPQCQTEIPKYASLGLMVLCTGTLGMVSGGYALFTIFGNVQISALFGMLWGVFVGGIDRYFVITARKSESGNSNQITMAIPRLVFAAFIGLIISKPLELRIFKAEIESQLYKEQIEDVKQVEENSLESKQIDRLEQQKAQLRQQEQQLREKWSQAEQIAHEEAEGKSGTGKQGKGSVYKEKRTQADELLNQLKQKQQQIAKIQNNIDRYTEKLDQNLVVADRKQKQASTLLGQLQALHNLAEEKPIVGQINLCITLLFVIVEIMPLSLKLMTKFGPYDKALATKEEEVLFELNQRIETVKNTIKDEIKNSQFISQQIDRFVSEQMNQAIAKATTSTELELAIDNTVKSIVERTEKDILKQVNKLPIDDREIAEEIVKSQREYMKNSVKENINQKVTESRIDDLYNENLEVLNDYNTNSNNTNGSINMNN